MGALDGRVKDEGEKGLNRRDYFPGKNLFQSIGSETRHFFFKIGNDD